MPKGKSPRNFDVIKTRREKLIEIQSKYYRDEKHLSPKLMLKELDKAGFKIDRKTLYNDRKYLAESNNFVRDIAESFYSQMIEDMFNDLEHIKGEAYRLAEKEWIRRTVKDKTANGQTSQERSIDTNEATPKGMFLKLAVDCVKEQANLLKGDVMNYSVAFLSNKMRIYKSEVDRLTRLLKENGVAVKPALIKS